MGRLQPRKPSGYDSAIHGRADYGCEAWDGEPDDEVAARTDILDAIGRTPEAAKYKLLRVLFRRPDPTAHAGPLDDSGAACGGVISALASAPPDMREELASRMLRHLDPVVRSGRPTTPLTVWQLGDRTYAIGTPDADPIAVTTVDDYLLAAFASRPEPKSRSELERQAGVQNVPRAMKQLTMRYGGRFAPAVRRPGRKGRGGYLIRVCRPG